MGRFQQAMNPVGDPVAVLLHMHASPQQIAQFANFLWRYKAGAYQSILKQPGNARSVHPVSLMTRQRFNVLRIQKQ